MVDAGSSPPGAPALEMADGLSWHEDALRWQLQIPAEPEQAAQMIGHHRLQVDPNHPYRWVSSSENSDSQLRLTVSCSGEEWPKLQKSLSEPFKKSRRKAPVNDLCLEWPFLHPALKELRPGTVTLGNAVLSSFPEDNKMVMHIPASLKTLDTLRNSSYILQPANEWQEDILWGDVIMGKLIKNHDAKRNTPEGPPPFLVLHGLSNSLGNQLMMRPFAAPLPITDLAELRRIILETCQREEEGDGERNQLGENEMEYAFRQEYGGFAGDDMELLMRCSVGLTEGTANEVCEVEDLGELSDEWMRTLFNILVTAIICGSRVARAELARSGYNTDLSHCSLNEMELQELINGQLSFADSMRRAIRDERSSRVWSLPSGACQTAEILLGELLIPELPNDPTPEAMLGDILLCFDLGVRYQMARVAPELLEVAEAEWEIELEMEMEMDDDEDEQEEA